METCIDNASKRVSDIHLSGKIDSDAEDEDPSEVEQQRYNELIMKGKKLIGEGRIEDALKLNKKALNICYSEKLAKKVKKMEDYLKVHADDSADDDDDNGMIHLGKGFYLFRDLYNSLYAHQQEGVLWLWSLFRRKKGGILGDDMGLGKTIQIIGFLSGMFDMQKIKSVLIVLPVAVMVNWDKEFQKWAPGLKVVVYHGNSKREKERALARVQRRGGVCLTTYGLVVTSWEQMGQHDGREFVWDYMILDEGHKIKNPTKTSKGVHAIPARNRIILTGTPVQNNLKELWSLFDFVHQGSLLGLLKTFKMEFDNPITRAREKDATLGEKKLGMEMAESLKKIISPYFLRRTKAEVKEKEKEKKEKDEPDAVLTHAVMPTMTRKNDLIVWTFLRDTQLNIYQDFLSLDSVKELLMTTKSPLVALNVLKKICDHPRLLSTRACAQLGIEGDEGLDDDILETEEGNLSAVTRIEHIADDILINESGKLLFLVRLLDRLKVEGHRCLVFSQSRKMLDIMQKVLTNRGHKIMRLDGTIAQIQERENRIQTFQTNSSYSVFLLTTQVGGVGLTLTAADRVVIFDPSWNPATDAQAVDRVFRIGQDKNVVIYRLITCGTVEEKIYRRQIFKDSITRQTTGNAKNPHRYFSKNELRELFIMDDPRSSTTQQQLEQMHSGQRLTDTSLDEHIAYLYSLEMFGLSDHDLMFSHGNKAGDEQDEDDDAEPAHDYIQHRVQKAREIIQMESSQPGTREERLGKSSQQTGGGEGRGGHSRIQFENWNLPRPVKQDPRDADATESSQRSITPERDMKDLTSPVMIQPEHDSQDKAVFANIVVIRSDGSDGASFPLTTTSCTIGRSDECDIRIRLPQVEWEHCRLEVNKRREIFIVNFGTTYPVHVNKRPIKGTMQMKHGDVFTIVGRSFRLYVPQGGKPPNILQSLSKSPETTLEEPSPRQQSQADLIDLTSTPRIKRDPSEVIVTDDRCRVNLEPMDTQHAGSPIVKQKNIDCTNTEPGIYADIIDESMDIGTPKRYPLNEQDLNVDNRSPVPVKSTTTKPGTTRQQIFPTTPKSAKKGNHVIREEIMISPDASRPLLHTRPSAMSNLSMVSMPNASSLQPNLNSTIFGLVDSPDIVENLSGNSRNSSGSSSGHLSLRSVPDSPSVQPFQTLVADSPDNSNASSSRHKQLSEKLSSSDETDVVLIDSDIDDSVIIDDSVVLSEGEEKENIEPSSISVHDIRGILEKSLCSNIAEVDDSFNDSPIVTKSCRKSTAFRRRVIESSDEDDDQIDGSGNMSVSDNDSANDGDDSANDDDSANYGNTSKERTTEKLASEADSDEAVERETSSCHSEIEDEEKGVNYTGSDDISHAGADDVDESDIDEAVDENNDDVDISFQGDEHDRVDDDIGGQDDENATVNEEETDEDEHEFDSLPETEQVRYNELVEAGRIYCQSKQFEEGQGCVLQALEIFADPDLQATSITIQRKIVKQQARAQRAREQQMQT